MSIQPIGVMGCLTTLPAAFPIEMAENAGNLIHGNAPMELFPQSVFYKEPRFRSGGERFVDFVNANCSHLIVTVANFIKLNDENGARYARFQRFLESVRVPIVIFGLGSQAPSQDLVGTLPEEAITLMKFLGDRTEAVGVRGGFTAAVFDHFAGVTNTFVTGCPSFFSRPHASQMLADSISQDRTGRPAYSGTTYHDPLESKMLARAIEEDNHLIEPMNKFSATYANALQRGSKDPPFPWFLKRAVKDGTLTRPQVDTYFSTRFRLFRSPEAWYAFNSESVGFSYGTRFHVNMASLLSGVPALWVTHDSRTQELTQVLRLPALSKEQAADLGSQEMRAMTDYRPMFRELHSLFDNFNAYLRIHGLPNVSLPNYTDPYSEPGSPPVQHGDVSSQ